MTIPGCSAVQDNPNYVQLDTDSRLIVCLCDLSADDTVAYLAGAPIEQCAQHKVAKLESIANAGLRTAIVFSEIDERGDFQYVSLEDARKRIQLNGGAS